MASQESIPDQQSPEKVFENLERYPWASDDEFQSGLQAIVEGGNDMQDREALTLQARCFYYSRHVSPFKGSVDLSSFSAYRKFGVSIDPAAYSQWRKERPTDPSQSITGGINSELGSNELETGSGIASTEKPPYPLSFNRLVELITEGKEVPGIKEIPDTLLEGQASQSTSTQRKKPWEK